MTADPTTTLAAHRVVQPTHHTQSLSPQWHCLCGLVFQSPEDHAAHQLSVLSATHAIIELPEPLGDDGVNVAWKYASMWHDKDVVTAYVPRSARDMTPDKARAVAADLLAAARQAEEAGQ